MNFNKLEEISFSKSDIGYSKLLHIPVGVYKYHDIELYLVPLTMENYEDPLFSANFPVIGNVVDFSVGTTDDEKECLKQHIGELVILPNVSEIRTDGKGLYIHHWGRYIKISYAVVSNPYTRSGWYEAFTRHPEFDKEFTEVIKPTKSIKTLYEMIYNWTRMELVMQRIKCQKIIGDVITLENRLLQLDLIKEGHFRE